MIVIEDATVIFGAGTPNEMRALNGLSLTIDNGQFVTVVGSNGSGKSTLLNAIAGEAPIERGLVFFDGTDVTRKSPHARARFVARVFQDPLAGTCEALTVAENMAMAAGRGRRRWLGPAISSHDRRRYADALAGIGLEKRLGDRIGLLSGGQRQAISLIMATLAPSRILLLDEHTAALDPAASQNVLALTEQVVRETGLTTLMITHSMRDAIAFGDRLVMLHQGKVALDVRGDDKKRLTVAGLLDRFGRVKGATADEDRLLLA